MILLIDFRQNLRLCEVDFTALILHYIRLDILHNDILENEQITKKSFGIFIVHLFSAFFSAFPLCVGLFW